MGYLGGGMATESENRIQMNYLDTAIGRAIIGAIGNSHMAFSQVVSTTGYPREEVATWLLDMERNGLISHSIEVPTNKSEAVFKLSRSARLLLHQPAP